MVDTFKHDQRVSDLIEIEGRAQGSFAYTGTAAQSSALGEGHYDIWSDQDCYIKVAAAADDVAVATGYLLRANNTITVKVSAGKKIGAIRASASGTLYYHQIG